MMKRCKDKANNMPCMVKIKVVNADKRNFTPKKQACYNNAYDQVYYSCLKALKKEDACKPYEVWVCALIFVGSVFALVFIIHCCLCW